MSAIRLFLGGKCLNSTMDRFFSGLKARPLEAGESVLLSADVHLLESLA